MQSNGNGRVDVASVAAAAEKALATIRAKREAPQTPGNLDCWSSTFPVLAAVLCATAQCHGTGDPPTLTLWVDRDGVRGVLHAREEHAKLFGHGEGVEEFLGCLDALLSDPNAPWRHEDGTRPARARPRR